ncbi:hypothetical protein K491DRAFT_602452 [Lophiostoma macrostomum CBS 122681]|uniref:CFEM domain-containing protein n=1 Tax=Lophiostoma macrostomum CBS 122681 TaxID=1314788 RepID=A0A6A6T0W1_9PLEO|nr:hypothetical protein K491DRAFT_602452 [Lophiostoma macrostomum CBS 122681]
MLQSTLLATFAAVVPFVAAQRTFNVTEAFAPGNWKKYHCIDTDAVVALLPTCLAECNYEANAADGCAYDDIACHCINYNVYSPIIEKCALPAEYGGAGACTDADLGIARPIVNDLCNFFNATLYADYTGCPQELSPKLTTKLVFAEESIRLDV